MRVELFSFQKKAVSQLLTKAIQAKTLYISDPSTPQIISYTAPTGAGKTVILSALIESIYCGTDATEENRNAIFLWFSDSPELNMQSRQKIEGMADRLVLHQCVQIEDETFDRETLENGRIYFINMQKFASSSRLMQHSDDRQYTIWDTLRNTIEQKSSDLYVIIDEAHRGAQGVAAFQKANTIMQQLMKGNDLCPPMPCVIGVSATIDRFNALTSSINCTQHKVTTDPADVKASGLLKDRIIVEYPADNINEMALLQTAADEWRDKSDHWWQYCNHNHTKQVCPAILIQVKNGNKNNISDTDLDSCLRVIEERLDYKFKVGEVVHTFGQTNGIVKMNGLDVEFAEPSSISDNPSIRVIFFKENLSTGWDCPRAETMMSFRVAEDATAIAQLLGRMVRTPLQQHVNTDDSLNEVRLFLPFFNKEQVNKVIQALKGACGDITEIDTEEAGSGSIQIWTTEIPKKVEPIIETLPDVPAIPSSPQPKAGVSVDVSDDFPSLFAPIPEDDSERHLEEPKHSFGASAEKQVKTPTIRIPKTINRKAIIDAINSAALPNYEFRKIRLSKSHLVSLFKLTRFLSQSALNRDIHDQVKAEIVGMINTYIEGLKANHTYKQRTEKVIEIKLSSLVFDTFGNEIVGGEQTLYGTTTVDVERNFRAANKILGDEGIGELYGQLYADIFNTYVYQVEVILFASEKENVDKVENYAKSKFNLLHDEYRRKVVCLTDNMQQKYKNIITENSVVSEINFTLPDSLTINVPTDANYKSHTHLYVNPLTGIAQFKMNSWEVDVMKEEEAQHDFIAWYRNPSKVSKNHALKIPYRFGDEDRALCPDFIVVRKDIHGYIFDILEPHSPDYADNLPKAKGLAKYASCNSMQLGRVQMIRKIGEQYVRLDFMKKDIQDAIANCTQSSELNSLFSKYGHTIEDEKH